MFHFLLALLAFFVGAGILMTALIALVFRDELREAIADYRRNG